MGFVSLIVIVKTFAFVPLLVVMKPLKKPVLFANGAHGESNDPSTTECSGAENTNSIELPVAAVMVLGEKARAPFAPTVTVCSPEVEEEVVDAGAAADEVVLESLPAGAPY